MTDDWATSRYKHVTYRIGRAWNQDTGQRLPPEEERRILEKMNRHLFKVTRQGANPAQVICPIHVK